MIIKKFKEIKNKWSENDMKNHLGNDNFLKEKLSEYLKWKLNLYEPYVEEFFYSKDGNKCYLRYYTTVSDNDIYEVVDTDEMVNFINNSNLYKNTKTYNI